MSDAPVDLSNCDREPIHELGHVQPFGGLIAVNDDWLVAHASTNVAALLGLEAPLVTGERLSRFIAGAAYEELRSAVSMLVAPDQVERLFSLRLGPGDALFDCALHRSGTFTIIEFEPHEAGDLARQFALLRPVVRRLERHATLSALCEEAARQLRMTLKFDRVMVYRFHPDESGEVIAEARREDLESFLGLHYPKSDIPAQARALYLRNRFRIISDIDSEPVPIEPRQSIDGHPLDLSMSTLRAVSPIHIEYLRNMGVAASLSISIIVDGRLWGLFACHHYSPRVLPYSQRTAAELFSELFSLILERVQARQDIALRETGQVVHDRLMRDIASGTMLSQSLPLLSSLLQEVIPHDGATLFVEDIFDARGAAPNEEEFRAILPQLNAAATSRVIAIEAIAERVPRAERFADRAAGALVIPVSRTPRDHLILWRRPMARTVRWAGNPEKPVTAGPNGARLTPRKSFAAWLETVEGRGDPWTESERKIAEGVRVTLLEIILRLTDEAMVERAKAQQQQELLISELNHRVRNILNLIRGLVSQSRNEAADIAEFTRIIGGRIGSLAAAHDNITRSNWNAAPLRELVETETHAYLGADRERVVFEGPEVLVSPEAYTVLALVLHEMVTNSAKYGALSDGSGRLTLAAGARADGSLELYWRERGGPPVKPPKRRGFGSTIIERSIPFELEGESRVDYKLEGLEARFSVPARYVIWSRAAVAAKGEERSMSSNGGDAAGLAGAPPACVLLVEDSMIIALDTEDCLRDLGVEQVLLESSVAGALDRLNNSAPALALLDFNLGKESSEAVAAELVRRGIPFWLATGYGEMRDRLDEIGAAGLLVKPYGKDQLAAILAQYGAVAAS